MFIFGEKFKLPALNYIPILMFIGLVYYYINVLMYKGLKHLNTGTFFMIGYSYLIFLFFINILVYGGSEILSPLKTLFAFIFIGYILFLTYKSGTQKGKNDIIGYLLALTCSLGWTFCLFVEGYYIKNSLSTPIMILLIMYSGSLLTGSANYFINNNENLSEIIGHPKKLLISGVGGILIFLGTVFLLYSYRHIQLNIANTVSTSEIFFTTLFAIVLLKEKHSKKEIIDILIGFILLMIFVYLR